MRLWVTALVAVGWGSGCTAVTDFNQFHIGSTADLAAVDLTYVPAAFGEPCDPGQTTPCKPGDSVRALQCFTSLDGHPVSQSICTRECNAIQTCTEYPNTACAMGPVAQPNYCLPRCQLPGTPCRSGLTCCGDSGPISNGAGICQPVCG
jgi:hypothetical protein